ncbi:unnamed protein product [Adineta ricciae]|uniref:Uncharacterized protein n=1 Tax=Adineta ricciae TaxID=249248 RepID=A0A814P6E8_ADIRI|nr:unnamed protein product [Adineta ricciae]
MTFYDGDIRLNGSFCYVPQESWIYSSTIKENILFGKDFNENLFENVLQSTALDLDFNQFPLREQTIVGDQGAMDKKARINLARALYSNADIYLLDDPLSAVDTKVAKHLFEKTIKGFLKDKICILVTHQIQFLENATKIILLYDGELAGIGNYQELMENCLLFQNLLNDIHQNENQQIEEKIPIEIKEEEEEEEEELNINSSINQNENEEKKAKGRLKFYVYFEYLRSGFGFLFAFFILPLICLSHQGAFIFSNYWLALWNDEENYRNENFTNCSFIKKHQEILSLNQSQWIHYRNNKFHIYSGIVILFIVISLFRTILIQYMFLNASRILHNKMFHRIIRTPIEFFDTNPIGRILNRFTKDISIMDNSLPHDAFDFLDCCFQVLGVIVLVCYLQIWSIIPSVICTISLLFVRTRFASTSRDLKRIEGITRSPIYSHLTSTIQGLKVIRSSNNEHIWLKQFENYLNDNTNTNHLIITTNRWAAVRFDWVALIFISLVTLSSMILRLIQYQLISPSQIALILSYSLSLMALLQWTIRQSVVIESQMTSVERVLEYCSVEQEEENNEHQNVSLTWPSKGEIVFENISMKYSKKTNSSIILKNISMRIESNEKIGIVGRTGAGKSSIIQILFRLGYLTNGQILIDNVDIHSIDLNLLRNRISIIPQDPILFLGTVRSNLDPLGIYQDQQLWNVLEEVQLKNFIIQQMSDGLQSEIQENGGNLSVGQKQLICLARAILKQTKIIVIDEATANVDHVTDELIQRTIREKFQQSTVLTVAHRLRTIIDNQRILVLHHGRLVEFDTPKNLLSNPNSYFSSLVDQTGPLESKFLRDFVFQN